ncbi:hypothetical protein [Sphingomonas rhizophila]|uniref:hypothetical protein n=1 Tax=Sphingomonas rhizophila TaxID=2071607 RepID=UPI001FEB3456|nr:hypothetical protein [Sphingomonas rhizophila]
MSADWIPLLMEAAGRCGDDGRYWEHFLRALPAAVRHRIAHEWRWQAHGGQVAPPPCPTAIPGASG